MYFYDAIVFTFASVTVYYHLRRVQKVDPIEHMSKIVLYSNCTSTSIMATFAVCLAVSISILSIDPTPNLAVLDILP